MASSRLREEPPALRQGLVEEQVEEVGVGLLVDPVPDQAEGERQRHQALLGPIMQVALHPAAFGVPGLHDPRP